MRRRRWTRSGSSLGLQPSRWSSPRPVPRWDVVERRVDPLLADGYVDLDPQGRPGLGAHVHARIGVPVIGATKTAFRTATHAVAVHRGNGADSITVHHRRRPVRRRGPPVWSPRWRDHTGYPTRCAVLTRWPGTVPIDERLAAAVRRRLRGQAAPPAARSQVSGAFRCTLATCAGRTGSLASPRRCLLQLLYLRQPVPIPPARGSRRSGGGAPTGIRLRLHAVAAPMHARSGHRERMTR